MIEANPANFFTDSHTNLYVAGVVRGQLNQSYVIFPNATASTNSTASATSARPTFTGAASTKSVSGMVLLAGLVAALL